MDALGAGTYDIYRDISIRTNGEIYIGIVGPVRTGKSTFIKNFMETMVLPQMEDIHEKERAIDELPQSAQGKTIMTTEPKFVPKDAALIDFGSDMQAKIRLVDCVGYMVEGAAGHIENEQERLVKTPWFEEEIPFTEAATIGTEKVIREHATIGIVITTDGSFGELERENYKKPEQRTIEECKKIGKPFIVLLNTQHPYKEETVALAQEMMAEYQVMVLPVNVKQLRKEDIYRIFEGLLTSFPLTRINFYLPDWVEMLPNDHWLKMECIEKIRDVLGRLSRIQDVNKENLESGSEYIQQMKIQKVSMDNGEAEIDVRFDDKYYYQILSDLIGIPVANEKELIRLVKRLASGKEQTEKLKDANEQVAMKGYGVVLPVMEEIQVEEPEVVKHGNKYGVKIRANAPSVHLIKANIVTEISPIVGTKEEAEDLIDYIHKNARENPDGIWETNIFGKSIRQLVNDGIQNKVNKLTEESQVKLQETIQKVINDSNGGLVCIII